MKITFNYDLDDAKKRWMERAVTADTNGYNDGLHPAIIISVSTVLIIAIGAIAAFSLYHDTAKPLLIVIILCTLLVIWAIIVYNIGIKDLKNLKRIDKYKNDTPDNYYENVAHFYSGHIYRKILNLDSIKDKQIYDVRHNTIYYIDDNGDIKSLECSHIHHVINCKATKISLNVYYENDDIELYHIVPEALVNDYVKLNYLI